MNVPRRAVFLDRDGVINRPVVRNGKPYPPATLEELEILPGVREGIENLVAAGFLLYVVTNQPDIARGTQARSVVEAMHEQLRKALPIQQFYTCFHDDADGCVCRKPKPGLLHTAAAENNLELSTSYMVGDRWRDIDCGAAAGCTTVFIDRGYSESLKQQPHLIAPDLLAASALISNHREGTSHA